MHTKLHSSRMDHSQAHDILDGVEDTTIDWHGELGLILWYAVVNFIDRLVFVGHSTQIHRGMHDDTHGQKHGGRTHHDQSLYSLLKMNATQRNERNGEYADRGSPKQATEPMIVLSGIGCQAVDHERTGIRTGSQVDCTSQGKQCHQERSRTLTPKGLGKTERVENVYYVEEVLAGKCGVVLTHGRHAGEVVGKDGGVANHHIFLWDIIAILTAVGQKVRAIVEVVGAKLLQLARLSVLSKTDSAPGAELNERVHHRGQQCKGQ